MNKIENNQIIRQKQMQEFKNIQIYFGEITSQKSIKQQIKDLEFIKFLFKEVSKINELQISYYGHLIQKIHTFNQTKNRNKQAVQHRHLQQMLQYLIRSLNLLFQQKVLLNSNLIGIQQNQLKYLNLLVKDQQKWLEYCQQRQQQYSDQYLNILKQLSNSEAKLNDLEKKLQKKQSFDFHTQLDFLFDNDYFHLFDQTEILNNSFKNQQKQQTLQQIQIQVNKNVNAKIEFINNYLKQYETIKRVVTQKLINIQQKKQQYCIKIKQKWASQLINDDIVPLS